MLLGLAAGKVGDLVFYRDGGEQRTRTRVIPKNPRSPKQMGQRVKMANIPSTYRALRSIIADGFTSRKSNQSGYNAFARQAIAVSPYLTKGEALRGSIVPAPYLISKGVLEGLPFEIREDSLGTGLYLPVPGLVADTANVGTVSTVLLNVYPSLANGDELHFVMMDFSPIEFGDSETEFKPVVSIKSFKIDTTSVSTTSVLGVAVEDDGLFLASEASYKMVSAAVVVSRVDGSGILQSSTSQLLLSGPATTTYSDWVTDNQLYKAIESYGIGEQSILRD